jgi:lipopolysaccharide/colanic/teichoic acid biosynthesis glycosyltransferase
MAFSNEVFAVSMMAAGKIAFGSEAAFTIPVNSVLYAAAKRCLNILLFLIGLAIAAPLFALSALVVRLCPSGRALFRQTRMGCGQCIFPLYRSRTIYSDAKARRALLAHPNEADGSVFIQDEPRITPACRVPRKLSLDELPQLINVLQGDLSLIGPRPPVPYAVAL